MARLANLLLQRLQFLPRLVPRALQDLILLALEAIQPLRHLQAQRLSLVVIRPGGAPLLIRLAQVLGQPLQQRGRVFLLAREPSPRLLDQLGRHPQAGRNFKRVTRARRSRAEAVSRAQRFLIERHGGVLHARRLIGENFQFVQVRRHHRMRAPLVQPAENLHSQRASLDRIGPRAQLVDQHQHPFAAFVQEAGNLVDMRGKGRKALLEALLVPDVRENLAIKNDARPIPGGYVQPRGGHQAENPDGLQHHRLAPGVRPGNDQGAALLSQLHVERDHLVLQRLDQQRMPRPAENQRTPRGQFGLYHAQRRGELPLGEREIQAGQNLLVLRNRRRGLAHQRGELAKDLANLQLLLRLQLPQPVPLLNHLQRLDERRGARIRAVMHNALDARFIFALHGQDVAVLPQRVIRFLEILANIVPAQHAVQAAGDPVLRLANRAPDGFQLPRGVVPNDRLIVDRPLDLFFQLHLRLDFPAPLAQQVERPGQRAQKTRRAGHSVQGVPHLKQLARIKIRPLGHRLRQ